MKTKMIISVVLTICLILAFTTPVFAASPVTEAGHPQNGDFTNSIGLSSEQIAPGMWVAVYGSGELTDHIVKPNSQAASEESWFSVTSFNAYIIITPDQIDDSMIPVYISGGYPSWSIPDDTKVKVTLHLMHGQQPSVTIRSSSPITVPYPYNQLYPYSYTMIQMVAGNIIYAK